MFTPLKIFLFSIFIAVASFGFNLYLFFRFNIYGETLRIQERDFFYSLLREQVAINNKFFLSLLAFIAIYSLQRQWKLRRKRLKLVKSSQDDTKSADLDSKVA